jgi:hypothetical protein
MTTSEAVYGPVTGATCYYKSLIYRIKAFGALASFQMDNI